MAMCTALLGQNITLPSAEGYTLADTQQVLDLNEEFKSYFQNDPEKAQEAAEKALAISQALDYKTGISRMSNNLGVFHSNQGDYPLALNYHFQNLRLLKENELTHKLGNCHNNIGTVLYEKGDLDAALVEFYRAYQYYEEFRDTIGAAHILNNVGSLFMDQGRLPQAQNIFFACLRIRETQGDSSYIAPLYSNIGTIYLHQGDYESAESYYFKALNVGKSMQDDYSVAAALNDLSTVYGESHRHAEAMDMSRRALRVASNISDRQGMGEAHLGLAEEFQMMKEADSALYHARKSMLICSETGRYHGQTASHGILGGIYKEQKQYDSARVHLEQAVGLANSNQFLDLHRQFLEDLSDVYAKLGDYESAYQSHQQFFGLHEKIFSEENNARLLELQQRYQVNLQEETILDLEYEQAQNELRITRGRFILTIFLAALLMLIGVAGILFYRNRKKQQMSKMVRQQKEEVEERNKWIEQQNRQILEINNNLGQMVETRTAAVQAAKDELDVFLYQSAHALRRPVVRIEGLLSLLEDKLKSPEDAVLVNHIQVSLNDMDDLLHQLVMVNEVERKDPELEPVHLGSVVESVRKELDLRGGNMELVGDTGFELLTDERLLKKLVEIAAVNSVQYCDGTPHIKVLAENHGDRIDITITDNGRGIPKGEEEKVFEMFYRADHRIRGNGLGLYVIRKICERLHGSVRIVPDPSALGTTLLVSLPPHAL